MSYLNHRLINAIPTHAKKAFGYYPDMIVYQHNNSEYREHWQKLAKAKYIYTDGYDLKPIGPVSYLFEVIKGWLGFTNHCEPRHVQLSLGKFAYYGYLQGFSQHLQQLAHYKLPSDYLTLVQKPRENTISKALQDLLINYYLTSADTIPQALEIPPMHSKYAFGECFKYIDAWAEIPKLDPQSLQLIADTINQLEFDVNPRQYQFIDQSQYAQTAAEIYFGKARKEKASYLYNWSWFSNAKPLTQWYLQRAIYFNKEITHQDLPLFIDYFVELKKFSQAADLIKRLSNIPQAVHYFTAHFTAVEQLQFIEPDTVLAQALAQYYLQKPTPENLKLAAQFDTNLAQHDPVNMIKLLIDSKDYNNAYNLFLTHQNRYTFSTSDLKVLANYFDATGESTYEEGLKQRKASNWPEAVLSYGQSLEAKEKAFKLQPTKERQEQYYVHMRLYAQVIIDADIQQHEIKHCDFNQLEEAINLLNQCASKDLTSQEEQKRHCQLLVTGLMRQVDYLTNLFSVPVTYAHDRDTRNQHQALHKDNFNLAISKLNCIIQLLAHHCDKAQKKILGKAYFLLGDISYFFNLPSFSPSYFEKAMETVPNNPFYLLRCSEVFSERKEKLQARAIPLLKKHGFEVLDYCHWDEDRWEKEERYKTSPIKDIHCLEKTESTTPIFSFT
ncbi:Uncharacterised protein [Legionella beliardensis]|uniref:Uncharacterized protein n=1 Tax=Legionella beliardensis TaxID=91822 RepID=A0A378HZJ3_9GAMM|nr:hypothetical protein [Legionella beliardensis]STX27880.1 Uncharacterised protein [Legionella beliardensis]